MNFPKRIGRGLIATFDGFERHFLVSGALIAACLFPAPVPAQDKELFTPDHVAKMRYVADAAISPDGKSVAYLLSIPRKPGKDESGPAWAELHVVSDQGESKPFVTGEVNVGAIAWTPDGKSISFLAKRNGDEHKSLYRIPVDGGEARNILSHETDIAEYSWSPDGMRVVFRAKDKEPKEHKKLEDKGPPTRPICGGTPTGCSAGRLMASALVSLTETRVG